MFFLKLSITILQIGGIDCGIFCCLAAERASRGQPFDFLQEQINDWRIAIALDICDNKIRFSVGSFSFTDILFSFHVLNVELEI